MSSIKSKHNKSLFPWNTNGIRACFCDEISDTPNLKKNNSKPSIKVRELETGFEIDIKASGFKKNEIEFSIKEKTLCILGLKKTEKAKKKNYHNSFSHFKKIIKLPKYVNDKKIKTIYENGILKLTIGIQKLVDTSQNSIEVS